MKMQKLTALLMAIIMLVTLMPVNVLADGSLRLNVLGAPPPEGSFIVTYDLNGGNWSR